METLLERGAYLHEFCLWYGRLIKEAENRILEKYIAEAELLKMFENSFRKLFLYKDIRNV